jgi:hypothetical protein
MVRQDEHHVLQKLDIDEITDDGSRKQMPMKTHSNETTIKFYSLIFFIDQIMRTNFKVID